MVTSIAFTVYPVKDMAAARRFYEEALGLKVGMNYQDMWVEYAVGDATFALTTMDTRHQAGAPGATVAFEVSDIDACAAKVREHGATMVQEPFQTPVCRMAIVSDPSGNDVILHRGNPA